MPEVQEPAVKTDNKEFDRFKAALTAIVKVKKEDVDQAMQDARSESNRRANTGKVSRVEINK